jgi:phage-related minor tail protein
MANASYPNSVVLLVVVGIPLTLLALWFCFNKLARRSLERAKVPGTRQWKRAQRVRASLHVRREREDAARKAAAEAAAAERRQREEAEALRADFKIQQERDAEQARQEAEQAQAEAIRERTELIARLRADGLFITDWETAERVMCRVMVRLGFPDAALTGRGADGGIDIASIDAVAQVKFQQARIGRPPVQQIRGAAGRRRALFFAYGLEPYTRTAMEWAQSNRVLLFGYDAAGEIFPQNRAAKRLASEAGYTSPTSRELASPVPTMSAEVDRILVKLKLPRAGDRCLCGGKLVLRENKLDRSKFFGCSRYPMCKRTVSFGPP